MSFTLKQPNSILPPGLVWSALATCRTLILQPDVKGSGSRVSFHTGWGLWEAGGLNLVWTSEGSSSFSLGTVSFPVSKKKLVVLRGLKKALGHETALTKQHVDELSINESETYGLNFPCSPQGLQNEGEESLSKCVYLCQGPEWNQRLWRGQGSLAHSPQPPVIRHRAKDGISSPRIDFYPSSPQSFCS